nr:gypsy retrotransposon integrase-like protein 1 [Tanacetum cinerariifolium]
MLKWKFKLEAFDITYRPRTSICSQVLADFIAKKADKGGPPAEVQIEETVPEPWVLFTNGSSCLEGSGAKLILINLEGKEFTYALRFEFYALNNKAEYEALIAGMRIAEQMGVKNLITKVDSRLVANQINGLYEAKEQSMTQYLEKAKMLIDTFTKISIEQGILPVETKKARAIKIKARQYTMINRVLYRKSFLEPWLRCIGLIQAEYVVKEIHEGSCSMYSGPRSVVAKEIKSGYYWPAMHKDARNIIRVYSDCQTHRPVPRNPQQKLTSITSPWTFYKSGIDISGPFPEWQGKVEEVPHVLWAHRTMIKTSNEDTSFSLTYGTEAVIPVKIRMPSIRCVKVNQAENDEGLLLNLDILKERREKAAVCEARSKAKMEKYYNAEVRSTSFRPGDFVYHSNDASHVKESKKLGPKWKGPYEVVEALGKEAYKLRNRSDDVLPRI